MRDELHLWEASPTPMVGREPIERETLYRKVDRTAEGFTLGEKIEAGD